VNEKSDAFQDLKTAKAAVGQAQRLRRAMENFREIQQAIAPFSTTKAVGADSTAGRWVDGQSLDRSRTADAG
jgi:hypothetical protein